MLDLFQSFYDATHNRGWVGKNIGFPETENDPPFLIQKICVSAIAHPVALDLSYPVTGVRSLAKFPLTRLPVLPMPEVPIAEDDYLGPSERTWRSRGDDPPSRSHRSSPPRERRRAPHRRQTGQGKSRQGPGSTIPTPTSADREAPQRRQASSP